MSGDVYVNAYVSPCGRVLPEVHHQIKEKYMLQSSTPRCRGLSRGIATPGLRIQSPLLDATSRFFMA